MDSLELIDLNMNNEEIIFYNFKDLIFFLRKESESSLFAELCSLIGVNENKNIVYKQMQNRSKEPNAYFIIDPYDYLAFIKKNSCLCVFHSHLFGDEKESEFDQKTSENCCYPFLIYSINTEKFNLYEPQNKDYDVNIIQRLKELL